MIRRNRAKRIDGNQGEIVKFLRKAGCVVEITSDVGRGFPDLVVRTPKGTIYLTELKDGSLPPSGKALTENERAVAVRWGTSYRVVYDLDGAAALTAS